MDLDSFAWTQLVSPDCSSSRVLDASGSEVALDHVLMQSSSPAGCGVALLKNGSFAIVDQDTRLPFFCASKSCEPVTG